MMTSAALLVLLCISSLALARPSPSRARSASRRASVSRFPVAMLPIDTQAGRMADFRRQTLEKKETFDEDEELFGGDDSLDDDDEEDYYEEEEEIEEAKPTLFSPNRPKWDPRKFQTFLDLRLGSVINKPVFWAAEGRLVHPASGKVLADVVGAEVLTCVRRDSTSQMNPNAWLHRLGFRSEDIFNRPGPPDGDREILSSVATAVAHRAYVYVDPRSGKPMEKYRAHVGAAAIQVEPVTTFSNVVSYALTKNGKLAVVSESVNGKFATAEDISKLSALEDAHNGFLAKLNPFRKIKMDVAFLSRPSPKKDAETLFPASEEKKKPPLVGFGKSKKGKAPAVQEAFQFTGVKGGVGRTHSKYTRFGECPSWTGRSGQTCALELNYVRLDSWEKVPEKIRSSVDKLAPTLNSLPRTTPGMIAYLRECRAAMNTRRWWFGGRKD